MQAESAQSELKLTIETCFKAQEVSTDQWANRLASNPSFNLEYRLMQLMKQRLIEKAGNDIGVLRSMIQTGRQSIKVPPSNSPQNLLTFTAIKAKKAEKLEDLMNIKQEPKVPKLRDSGSLKRDIPTVYSSNVNEERRQVEVVLAKTRKKTYIQTPSRPTSRVSA